MLRNLTMMAVVAAGIFYFAAMMPAFSFYYTAPYMYASFDGMATTLWSPDEVDQYMASTAADVRNFTVVWDAGTANVTGPGGSAEGVQARTIEATSVSAIKGTYYSSSLLRGLKPTQSYGVVVDTMTARRTGAKVGDFVVIDWATEGIDPRPQSQERIVALVLPTVETQGILLINPSGDPPKFENQVFLSLAKDGVAGDNQQGAGVGLPGYMSLEQAYQGAHSKAEAILSKNTRFVLIWVSMALYSAFLYWELWDRMKDRRKRHAIAISMGLEPIRLARMLSVEQFLLGSATALIGCVAGGFLMTYASGFYLPPDTFLAVLGYTLAVNMVLSVAIRWRLTREFRRLPVARLLAEG